MGYIRGVMHGAVAGTIAGLCLAPQQGKLTREQLGSFAGAAKDSYEVARRTVLRMAPVAAAAAGVAKERVERVRSHAHHDDRGAGDGNGAWSHHRGEP